MFPLRDHNPSGRTPYVTWAIILANVVIFLSYFPGFDSTWQANVFFRSWGLVPQAITSGQDYDRILTSMFLHGGWMHLVGNMWFLWIFGDNLEDEMGPFGFALFYLATGAAAAAAQVMSDPGSAAPMVGASGAIAGVMGGYLLLHPSARIDVLMIFVIFFRIFPIPAWIVLGVWFALQLASGAAMPVGDGGGVAYWAHAGGFVAGLVLALPVRLRRAGRTPPPPPPPSTPPASTTPPGPDLRPSPIPRVSRR